MKFNKENYSLEGEFTKAGKGLNPYTASPTANIFRLLSDMYSSKLMETGDHYTARELAALSLNFTGGRDFYSGDVLVDKDGPVLSEELIHRDHLFPASKGGLYAYGNVVITSQESNIEKSDMDPYEYYKLRFDNGKSTLYDTLDEAYAAITYLHSLYTERYPSAAEFVERSNMIDFPLSWDEFSEAFSKLFADSDFQFVRRPSGRKAMEFDEDIRELDFWLALNDPDHAVYRNLAASTVKDVVGSRLVHVSKLFSSQDLSVLEVKPKEIERMIEQFIAKDHKTKNETNKYRLIKRTILRYRKSYRDYQVWKENKAREED